MVLGPASFAGAQPGVIRGRNVTATSFQHNFEEWMNLDGAHVLESAGFLAAEAGRSTIGSLDIEAGSFFPADHNVVTINFSQAFPSVPVVIAQVATFNGSDPVAVRVSNVTTTGFQVRLQEEEAKESRRRTPPALPNHAGRPPRGREARRGCRVATASSRSRVR